MLADPIETPMLSPLKHARYWPDSEETDGFFRLNSRPIVAEKSAGGCVASLGHRLSGIVVCRIMIRTKAVPQRIVRPIRDLGLLLAS